MDANFGVTAGIAEMLLQSHSGVVELLPALPQDWQIGNVRGLKARGGFTVDIEWNNGRIKYAHIKASRKGKIKIKYKDIVKDVSLEKDEVFIINKG